MRFLSTSGQAMAAVTACVLLSGSVFAQGQPKPQAGTPPPAGQAQPPRPKPGDLKPYKDVITDAAKTQVGVFKVHRVDDKVYWEIPDSLLGRDFLWTSEFAEIPSSTGGYPGLSTGSRLIRFTRRNNRLLIVTPDYSMRSADKTSDAEVAMGTAAPVVQWLPIEAEGKDKSVVVDVTNIFQADASEFAVGARIGLGGADPNRSYIQRVTAFPDNIETRSVLTFMGQGARGRGAALTTTVHWSLNLLPAKPMVGRYADSRVGYFDYEWDSYGSPKNRVETKSFIARYRLEKKDPNAAVSDPVKPIVFYIGREVPEKWRDGIKRGVEEWGPVFEKAGFSNAIICKNAPTAEEDPTWDAEDQRYSVIRWAPSPVENAMGPHVGDPRSGETLSAHVIIWHNILALVQDWYFSQAAATDPRAQHLPLPDSLINDLLAYVVAHEVGHTLGLMHNFKASSAYTVAQMRDPKFTKENGLAASIMDYTRFNYVAQPGDGAATIGKVGPYDFFAINWGYHPIPSAKTPDDEKETLDIWAAQQVQDKRLRWAGDMLGAFLNWDPSTQMEDMTDDPIAAGKLGLENIRRIAKILPTAAVPYGEDYDLLTDAYNALSGQRVRELNHALRLVGGVVMTDYHGGRGDNVYTPSPASQQRDAAKFVISHLAPPPELLDPKILGKLQPYGTVRIATATSSAVLAGMFADSRLTRMVDNEANNGAKAYTVSQLIDDVTTGLWGQLGDAHPKVSLYDRVVQRAYLDTLDDRLNGSTPTKTDLRPLAIGELKGLAKKIDKAIPAAADKVTALHLEDARRTIERILTLKPKESAPDINSILASLFGVDLPEGQGQIHEPGCFQDPLLNEMAAIQKPKMK